MTSDTHVYKARDQRLRPGMLGGTVTFHTLTFGRALSFSTDATALEVRGVCWLRHDLLSG